MFRLQKVICEYCAENKYCDRDFMYSSNHHLTIQCFSSKQTTSRGWVDDGKSIIQAPLYRIGELAYIKDPCEVNDISGVGALSFLFPRKHGQGIWLRSKIHSSCFTKSSQLLWSFRTAAHWFTQSSLPCSLSLCLSHTHMLRTDLSATVRLAKNNITFGLCTQLCRTCLFEYSAGKWD